MLHLVIPGEPVTQGNDRGAMLRPETPRPGHRVYVDVKKLGRIERAGYRAHDDRRTWAHGTVEFLMRAHAWLGARGITIERILTDNGAAYRSHLHHDVCAVIGIRHSRTRPYRPRTNRKAERFIRALTERWAYAAIYRSSAERSAALCPWPRFYNHLLHTGGVSWVDQRPPAPRIRTRSPR